MKDYKYADDSSPLQTQEQDSSRTDAETSFGFGFPVDPQRAATLHSSFSSGGWGGGHGKSGSRELILVQCKRR